VDTPSDSYNNTFAETANSPYKDEPVHSQKFWESTQAVEPTTMGWIHRRDSARIHLIYNSSTEFGTASAHH
jgi:transposase